MKLRSTRRSGGPLNTKRSKTRVGSVSVNASDIKGLRSAWRSRQLVLFLGALRGVEQYYDVSADGKRFLMSCITAGAKPSTLTIELHWAAARPPAMQ